MNRPLTTARPNRLDRPTAFAVFAAVLGRWLRVDEPEVGVRSAADPAGVRFTVRLEPGLSISDLATRFGELPAAPWVLWSPRLPTLSVTLDADLVARVPADDPFATVFARALERLAGQADLTVAALAALDTADPAQARRSPGLGGPLDHTAWTSTVDGWFRAQAAATPRRPAVLDGDLTIDYATLDAWSDRLAADLVARGAGAGDRVAVCLPRGAAAVAGILGVLKSGAAYVPIGRTEPAARVATMLGAASARLAVVDPSGPVPPGLEGVPIGRPPTGPLPNPPAARTCPDDLAYLIFTSGSTGTPKGVAVEHRAVTHFAAGHIDHCELTSADRVLHFSVLTFDVSVQEIFGALLCGAALVVAADHERHDPDALADLVARTGVTVADFPVALLPVLDPDRFPGLRLVSTGSEALPPAPVAPWSRGRRLVNIYGPTEATVNVTYQDCAGEPDRMPPIGVPRPGYQALVLDEELRLVPDGAVGELCLAGPGVARGYLGRPGLTAERFVPNPYSVGPHTSRLYRTGDLARRLPEGSLEFLGRVDRQVNLRGMRIEPGEVEAALTRHPDVAHAAVVVAETTSGPVLAAYLVADRDRRIDVAQVDGHARTHLPEHMVPVLVVVDALPTNANGKLDRDALPPLRDTGHVAPRDATEVAVAGVFSHVFGMAGIGADDDFLALGGNSLSATRLVARLRTVCGVDVPVRTVFEHRTVAAIAGALASADRATPVPEHAAAERPRLSPAQRRLWFLDQLTPGMTAYTVVDTHRLRGRLDVDALHHALRDVLARHEVLRSCFPDQGGEPYVEVQDVDRLPVVVADLLDHREPLERARELARAEVEEPFDLRFGPLARLRLLRLADDDHVLLFTVHHTVFDGWSVQVFNRDVSTAYAARRAGRAPDWAPLPLSYADFAERQRHWPGEDVIAEQVRYWREQLADAPTVLDLPTDRRRPPVPSYRGGVHQVTVPAEVVRRLRALATGTGASLFMVMFSVFAALAARYAGARDVLIGSPVFGRLQPELEDLVGFFVNSLPLRADLTGDPTFTELVEQVRDTTLAALAHQEVPFEQLVEELAPPRDLTRNPVFQLWFDLFSDDHRLELDDLVTEPFPAGVSSTRFDLELRLWETPDGALHGELVYPRDLFDAETIARFAGHLDMLTSAVAADPLVRPLRADILTAAEHDLLCRRWAMPAGEPDEIDPRSTVQHRFAEQTAATPDATALEFGSRTLTYRELDREADRLARVLRGYGVGTESLVGLCLPRGVELIVAALAVLKAGAAYLGMDPGLPPDRLAFQVADSAAELVVTDSSVARRLPATPPRLLLDHTDLDAAPTAPLPSESTVDSRVYVIYTSGSTGRPKGVEMTQRPLIHLLDWQRARSVVHSPTLQFASINFDVSFQELFATWLSGGTVVLLDEDQRRDPEQLVEVLRRHRVRRLFCPPMVLVQLAETPSAAGLPLAEIVPAGEELRITGAVRNLLSTMPGVEVDNEYGPTEAHAVTAHRLTGDPRRWPASVPVGRPLPGTRVLVLDDALLPVPVGVPGEICIGGDHVARGYRGRPGTTAERFVPDPFGTRPGARLYRTGDRGVWRPDGTLRFLGRLDHQVKVRGYRVEPGEIEAVLRAHPALAEVAVTPIVVAGFTQLAAYVVPHAAAPGHDELRAHIRSALPEYMVPAFLVTLDALPLTRNGKLDRSALPDPAAAGEPAEDDADRSPQQRTVAGIWASSLGVPDVGLNANFFDVGGHSLLATKVISRVRSAFEVNLPLRALFDNPTVAGLTRAVEEALAAEIDAMSDDEVSAAVHGVDGRRS
jgi:amino acid adenylation domain-containing protein